MDSDELAELVATVGYGSRVFIGRLNPPAFCDQRLVPIDVKAGVDIDLLHALANTTISMFLIEGLGFGRGLGVLDLNKDRMEGCLHVLDPSLIDREARVRIMEAFAPLLLREIEKIPDELTCEDRHAFDDVVLEVFEINVPRERIYDALRALHEIRLAAIG